jgi:hypothetical protein
MDEMMMAGSGNPGCDDMLATGEYGATLLMRLG